MFVGITNTPREYAWGSTTAIPELLGLASTGEPQAELWLGTHPGSPSRVIGGDGTLSDVVGGQLPFLLKVLAASSPLSLQAHPTMEQAAAGFARENATGVPIDAPNRNYKDSLHKPELIYALSEQFEALCGFRPAAEIHETIARLIQLDAASPSPNRGPLHRWLDRTGGDASLGPVFEWLTSRGEGVDELVARVVELAREHPDEFPTVIVLSDAFPGDPGIVVSLLLNHVTLAGGEVLYLPAGNIHAYLRGFGIELMSASDNVLRGGLTPKHVDVAELLAVLDFTPGPVPYLAGAALSPHVTGFRPPVRDFQLIVIDGDASFTPPGPAIAICVDGDFEVSGTESATIGRGAAVYVADEGELRFTGSGLMFLATTQ